MKSRTKAMVIGAALALMGGAVRGVSVPMGRGWGSRTREAEKHFAMLGAPAKGKNSKRKGQGRTKAKPAPGREEYQISLHWSAAQLRRVGLRKVRHNGRMSVTALEEMEHGAWDLLGEFAKLPRPQRRAVRLGIKPWIQYVDLPEEGLPA